MAAAKLGLLGFVCSVSTVCLFVSLFVSDCVSASTVGAT